MSALLGMRPGLLDRLAQRVGFCFGPGDVVLADDLTGKGHTTRSLGVPRVSATVAVAE